MKKSSWICRLLGTLFLVTTAGSARADLAGLNSPPGPETRLPTALPRAIPNPAAADTMGSSLAQAADGTTYLSWLEPVGVEKWAMKFSRFDSGLQQWGAARIIAQGADWFINWADFPFLTVQQEQLTAVWFVNNPGGGHGHHESTYHAQYSVSTDGGVTWSPPQPLTRESNSVEFATLQPLRDGRLLAAWLDGRAHAASSDRQALYARILAAPGPDLLVDDSVCDCCQLSLAPTAEGGALLAYRGRTKDEVRDIHLARFTGQSWNDPNPLHADNWKISGCPVNGPQLTVAGDRTGVVWFTSAGNQPQVLARVSVDAGKSFGPVHRIDLGRPQGRVDCVLLADGTLALIWLEAVGIGSEAAGGIYLRTLSPAGLLSAPRMILPSRTDRMSGFARMILASAKSVLLTCTQDREPSRIATFLIDLE